MIQPYGATSRMATDARPQSNAANPDVLTRGRECKEAKAAKASKSPGSILAYYLYATPSVCPSGLADTWVNRLCQQWRKRFDSTVGAAEKIKICIDRSAGRNSVRHGVGERYAYSQRNVQHLLQFCSSLDASLRGGREAALRAWGTPHASPDVGCAFLFWSQQYVSRIPTVGNIHRANPVWITCNGPNLVS
jgi:hypothetical protein